MVGWPMFVHFLVIYSSSDMAGRRSGAENIVVYAVQGRRTRIDGNRYYEYNGMRKEYNFHVRYE
jgi:hypothetical protein